LGRFLLHPISANKKIDRSERFILCKKVIWRQAVMDRDASPVVAKM
jgi:hypothetical protein